LPLTFRTGEKNKDKELRNDVFFSRKAARILGTDSAESFFSRREQVRLLAAKGVDVAMSAALRKHNSMKVVDVMTRDPMTLTPAETVGQADELMTQNRFRQIPIVMKKELVGIVTDRDVRSFLSGSLLANPHDRDRAFNTPIQEIMTTDPITVSPDDDLQEIVELLIEEKIGGVPVVDETEGLVGIVTYVDLLRCFLNRLQED
jgi:CBS domain-containing protein